jgi:hypothetical protein
MALWNFTVAVRDKVLVQNVIIVRCNYFHRCIFLLLLMLFSLKHLFPGMYVLTPRFLQFTSLCYGLSNRHVFHLSCVMYSSPSYSQCATKLFP